MKFQHISHFTICMNPQALNPLTIGNYPRKIDEYLAMGKPVIATSTEAMQTFPRLCFFVQNKRRLCNNNNQILATPHLSGEAEKQRRINFAFTHSWENSIGS